MVGNDLGTAIWHYSTMPQSATVGDLIKSLSEKSGAPSLLYQSYLLRLWRENPNGPWRATLEEVASGKTYSFARLESLIEFLNDPRIVQYTIY